MTKFETVEEVRSWYRERYPGYPVIESLVRKCCESFGIDYKPPENQRKPEPKRRRS